MSKASVMLEVIAAFNAGRAIQGSPKGAEDWRDCSEPAWAWDRVDYRIKPIPNDVIPWDCIADEWQWSARDRDGRTFVYHVKPQISSVDTAWHGLDGVAASHVLKIEVSERNWKDTLQKRPEKPVERFCAGGVLSGTGQISLEQAESLFGMGREIIRGDLPAVNGNPLAKAEPSSGARILDGSGRVVVDNSGIRFYGGPMREGKAPATIEDYEWPTGSGRLFPEGKHGEGCEHPSSPGVAVHIQKIGRGNRNRQASEEERRAAKMEQAPCFADRFARSIERRIHGIIPAPKRD